MSLKITQLHFQAFFLPLKNFFHAYEKVFSYIVKIKFHIL